MGAVDTEALARGYTTMNTVQSGTGLFLIDRIGITPGTAILDVGCGPGNLTIHMASLVGPTGSVVGIDPSKDRVGLAQAALQEQKESPKNVSFYEGRAEDLSAFADASFDVVYVNSTFHWVLDQPRAMREFGRVLKPGGKVGISGGSGDFVAHHERIKEDVLGRQPYAPYPVTDGPTFLKRAELEHLLDQAGFGARSIVINTIVKTAKDGDEMIDWLDTSSSGKLYGGIPEELKPGAREEMRKEWEKVTGPDGIRMEMELLVTVAVKA
jgi:arsenite methyltransferase